MQADKDEEEVGPGVVELGDVDRPEVVRLAPIHCGSGRAPCAADQQAAVSEAASGWQRRQQRRRQQLAVSQLVVRHQFHWMHDHAGNVQ